MKLSKNSKRFVEIDLLRGFAIILMILGHVLWDLDYFNLAPINSMVYSTLQKIVPALFFILVGIGIIIGAKKNMTNREDEKKYRRRLLIRGLKIFNLGVVLTILSLIIFPDKPVIFGVLHCIGLSIILSSFFLKYRVCNMLFASIFMITGMFITNIHTPHPSLLHLVIGFHQVDVWRYTIDYFPVLPWFGVVLLGIVIGDVLYEGNKRRFSFPDISKYKPVKIFSWFGRHSLEIYLLHQPIIAGAFFLFVRVF